MQKLQLDTTRFEYIIQGALVGVLAGIVVSLFRLAIENLLAVVKIVYKAGVTKPWWLLALGVFYLLVWLINARLVKAEPNISGSGIPQVEGQLAGELELSWQKVLWRKWVGGILAIGSGLFLGREGPSIQLGANVGQAFGEIKQLKGASLRAMIAGGAAAGLSAAFNAPIAAALFVAEEVYHNFSPLVWTTALSAAVTANLVSLYFFGMTPVLHMAYNYSFPLVDYGYLILLGILLGVLGILYEKMTLAIPKVYQKLVPFPRNLHGIIPLVLVIPIGLKWPDIIGGGNALIVSLGQQVPATIVLLGLFVLRLVFSTISFGSGFPGGIFLPILTLGAVLGGFYGHLLADFHLLASSLIVNCIIYAMAGYFACICKAPFTAILLVTEMVGSIKHLMPLAVVALIAYCVVDLLHGRPIYEAMLSGLIADKGEIKIHGEFKDRLEIPVFVGSLLENKQVRDVKWPKEALLIAIRRGENELLPHGDTVIRGGDILVILTVHQRLAKVRQQINHIAKQM
ncbi:H+/Cl-antiporter ClcA [Ligilactobacillus sp. WC1T17]|uniref:H+/Cl-antiporter ClcA n=1 Tax=Ligilactobacillus ruminis TaxID=1623 RepID=A0ABY1ABW5_9LACO|nr:H+/Cl-antiporter ClcA [Ligilactobacillus ruminis]